MNPAPANTPPLPPSDPFRIGELNEIHLALIPDLVEVAQRETARRIFELFTTPGTLREGKTASGAMRGLRRRVYREVGRRRIQKQAQNDLQTTIERLARLAPTVDGQEPVPFDQYQLVLALRTAKVLELIAEQCLEEEDETNLGERILPEARARYLKFKPEEALEKFFRKDETDPENPALLKRVAGQVNPGMISMWDAMNILALAAEHPNLPEDCDLAQAKQSAIGVLTGLWISTSPEIVNRAKALCELEDFQRLIDAMPEVTNEAIGGKSAGLFLVRAALRKTPTPEFMERFLTRNQELSEIKDPKDPTQQQRYLENLNLAERVQVVGSIPIGTDLFKAFIKFNSTAKAGNPDLAQASTLTTHYRAGRTPKDPTLNTRIQEAILNGNFPPHLRPHLKIIFRQMWKNKKPMIIRSSSLLEDGISTSFAGMYESIYIPYTEDFEADFEAFLTGIKKVYASCFNDKALRYRANHPGKVGRKNLLDMDEEMGLSLQSLVVESICEGYAATGVAAVVTSYAPRVFPGGDPQLGGFNGIPGMGSAIVTPDEGKEGALKTPSVRKTQASPIYWPLGQTHKTQTSIEQPQFEGMAAGEKDEGQPIQAMRILNVKTGQEHDVEIEEILNKKQLRIKENGVTTSVPVPNPSPTLARISSLSDRYGVGVSEWSTTTKSLLNNSILFERLRFLAAHLKEQLGYPVDLEVAISWNPTAKGNSIWDYGQWDIHILQCRPYSVPERVAPSNPPSNIPAQNIWASFNKVEEGINVHGLKGILYFDTEKMQGLSIVAKRNLHLYIAAVNDFCKKNQMPYIIFSPGRWGSKDAYVEGTQQIPCSDQNAYNGAALIQEIFVRPCDRTAGTHTFHAAADFNTAWGGIPKEQFSREIDPKLRVTPSMAGAPSPIAYLQSITGVTTDDLAILSDCVKLISPDDLYQTIQKPSEPPRQSSFVLNWAANPVDEPHGGSAYFAQEGELLPVVSPEFKDYMKQAA